MEPRKESHMLLGIFIQHFYSVVGFNGVLLGDTGYPCMPYLLTPYPEPATEAEAEAERAFKQAHTKTCLHRSSFANDLVLMPLKINK